MRVQKLCECGWELMIHETCIFKKAMIQIKDSMNGGNELK